MTNPKYLTDELFTNILTDPNEHNDKNFAYLVHSTRAKPEKIISLINDYLTNPDIIYYTSLIGVFDQEQSRQKLNHNKPVYHTSTYLNHYGFILKPKNEDTIKMSKYKDMFSPSEQKKLKEYIMNATIVSPRILLTQPSGINEILVNGYMDVVGIFYNERNSDKLSIIEEISKTTNELLGYDIPVFRIPELQKPVPIINLNKKPDNNDKLLELPYYNH